MNLLQELVNRKKITTKQAREINQDLDQIGGSVASSILKRKLLSEKELFRLKSEILKIPLLEEAPVSVPEEILTIIPSETASHYNFIAFGQEKKIIKIGMVHPQDIRAKEALKFLARRWKLEYEIFLITPSVFSAILGNYQTAEKEVKQALGALETELEKSKSLNLETKSFSGEIERVFEQAPIIKMVAVILREAIEGGASDIHLEPTIDHSKVRFRVDGTLHDSLFLPLKVHSAIIARIKILSKLKIDETRVPQDGRFSAHLKGRRIDFRVSTLPTTLGEKIAIRALDPQKACQDLEKLGLLSGQEALLKEAVRLPFGTILATGPTGCGKTTTLYSLLRILNTKKVNIVTLEDPVEYFISGVNQSQIRPEIDYTFSRGLRQIVRQDPDIIMVGEIRDEETAMLTTHAALTGHLVLSTIHTNNALGVIPRLVDMGVSNFLISPTLRYAIAQRLVRTLCPHCRKKIRVSGNKKKIILETIDSIPEDIRKTIKIPDPLYIWESSGCSKCNSIGYSGRIGIYEILKMTDRLQEILVSTIINEGKIKEEAQQQGMVTMRQAGIIKVIQGITSLEEVLRVTVE
jgi:type IV pilus assembly protein PilB